MELGPEELRVLGSLVEKELTTPQQYPLTLHALALACNQVSNREPVVHYDEATVEAAVTRAKTLGLVRFVHPSHGRSALRYRHELAEQLALGEQPLALLAVLVLRGPQTAGELRARTERMAGFGDLSEVEAELEALARREEPLVARMPRGPGQKEDRFRHLLAPAGPAVAGGPGPDVTIGDPAPGDPAAPLPSPAASAPLPGLAGELAELRAEVVALRRDLDELRAQLGA
ncbi:MAG: DUF480 domain-containing protein [Acidobacteriota bacterium]|nr:DUF480 domain-containing protein [Acidobacteriota bacterium]